VTKDEIENRIALYGLISRLMIIEVDTQFLELIESDEAILDMFPNYKNWTKKESLSLMSLKKTIMMLTLQIFFYFI